MKGKCNRACVLLLAIAMLLVLVGCSESGHDVHAPDASEAEGVMYNTSSGKWFDSAEEAFAEAQDADTLLLYEDVKSGALVSEAEGLTLDLRGFTLSVDATGSGARGGQGLAHSALAFGSGACVVANGSIVARVGAQPETTQSATTPYRGISSEQGGSLALSNVDVVVTYAGTSTIAPMVELDGVDAGGSLDVRDGSSVSVKAADSDGAFGAATVAGLRVAYTASNCTVSVSSDSTIEVLNNAQQIVEGTVGYPGEEMGATKASNTELAEIAVDASLDWYDDLCRRFRASADFDDRGDENGFVYGSEVYYASGLSLSNGLVVWAFSDPVSTAESGLLDSIVPSHVFVRSDYIVPSDAYGIWCGEGFSGTVSQAGSITAETTIGHAVGVYEVGSGVYELDESAIGVSCGKEAYRTNAGAFNLADFIDLNVSGDSLVVYPQQSSYTAVRQERSVAWTTAVSGEETWQYVTAPLPFDELFDEWDERLAIPTDVGDEDEETTVGLSLVYYRTGRDGSYMYTGEDAGTYVYASDLDLAPVANEHIVPGDIVEIGGVANRFLGWSPRVSDREPLYTDHIIVPDGNWGSFGAKLVLYGLYEPVEEHAAVEESAGAGESSLANAPSTPSPPTETGQAVSGAQPSASLPAGGLSAEVQEQEEFSPLGGIALLVCFAANLIAACLVWFARRRKLSLVRSSNGWIASARLASQPSEADGRVEKSPSDRDSASQGIQFGSDEQKRKGGLFF